MKASLSRTRLLRHDERPRHSRSRAFTMIMRNSRSPDYILDISYCAVCGNGALHHADTSGLKQGFSSAAAEYRALPPAPHLQELWEARDIGISRRALYAYGRRAVSAAACDSISLSRAALRRSRFSFIRVYAVEFLFFSTELRSGLSSGYFSEYRYRSIHSIAFTILSGF